MSTKPILYDLSVSIGAISLWLVPVDGLRLLGYSTSFIFAGDAYLRGLNLLVKERKTDEKTAIAYEADTDFYDQLLSQTTEAKLEIAALEVETRMLERLIPLVEHKNRLEKKLNEVSPQNQVSDSEGDAVRDNVQNPSEGSESVETDFRKVFPDAMDMTVWKGICKALGEGVSKGDIVRDVLGCSSGQTELGLAYFNYLKRRFLDG